MSKLVIRMTGLCAFVPKYDLNKKKNQMRLLLVESSRPSDLPDTCVHHTHEPHVPVFLCPHGKVDPDSKKYRQPDVVYGSTAVFYLDDQDLRIKDARPNSLEVTLRGEAGSGCHDDENQYSFEWVTSLESVSPGSGKIPGSCFCLSKSEVDPSVIARVELRQGKISTAQLAYGSDNKVILWEFKVPYAVKRGCHYQVAADIVEFEVDVKPAADVEDSVELITSPFREGLSNVRVRQAFDGKRDLPIRLLTKGTDIVTWIKNMPWADILGTREPQRYEKEPDIHFSHFYKLSSEYEDANVPHAFGRCGPAKVPHQGNPNCQPVRTAPNPNA